MTKTRLLALAPLGLLPLFGACSSSSSAHGEGASDGGMNDVGPTPSGTPLHDAANCYLVQQGGSGAGVTISATLLLPSGSSAGEVFVGSNGALACVAASCASTAGYSAATHIACTNAVISPGFVNAHNHTDYDADPPSASAHGTTRWEDRNEWRAGTDGAMEPLTAARPPTRWPSPRSSCASS